MNRFNESHGSRSPLHTLLSPTGIAIVGASADPTKRGYKALLGLIKGGYEGAIYPINPKAEQILDIPAWPSLADMPGTPELALLCTPAASVPALIAECGRQGIKGAVVLASGFGETGAAGAALEEAMMAAAEAHGMAMVLTGQRHFRHIVRELVGVPAVLRVAAVGVDAAQQAIRTMLDRRSEWEQVMA